MLGFSQDYTQMAYSIFVSRLHVLTLQTRQSVAWAEINGSSVSAGNALQYGRLRTADLQGQAGNVIFDLVEIPLYSPKSVLLT